MFSKVILALALAAGASAKLFTEDEVAQKVKIQKIFFPRLSKMF